MSNEIDLPDTAEIIEDLIENQIDLIDEDGNYPCYYCGKKTPFEYIVAISPSPYAPGMCLDCADAQNQINSFKR